MNTLLVGTHKTFNDFDFSEGALIIDDGQVIDAMKRKYPKAKLFDIAQHSINPLDGMNYRRARDFISILGAIFPEGENTLRREAANFLILTALSKAPSSLADLIAPDSKDPDRMLACQKLATLLVSPVIKSVLTEPTNFRFRNHTVLAKLDRAAIGDFDAFVIASFLVMLYPGQIVIPAFDFYGRDFHTALIREDRLIAGVNVLSRVRSNDLRQELLTIPEKRARRCTFEDAEVLANHAGEKRGTVGYDDFISAAMA